MAVVCLSDWLHIVFRLRRQMLEPTRRLDIGGLLVTVVPLQSMADSKLYRLSKLDMDFADKQCFEGSTLSRVINTKKYKPCLATEYNLLYQCPS